MTLPTIQFEGRLKAIGATSTKDGNWTKVEFQVHPSDNVSAMLSAGINSRWQVVVVQLGDDDQPVTPEKPKGGPISQRAGMLCGDERFQRWVGRSAIEAVAFGGNAADWLRARCGVESRAELDGNPEAAERFRQLETEYLEATGQFPERH